MNIKLVLALSILMLSSSLFAEQEQGKQCPTQLVNYWQNFAKHAQSPDATPYFLLNNRCFTVKGSTDFAKLIQLRLDEPERNELVDQMYVHLNQNAIEDIKH